MLAWHRFVLAWLLAIALPLQGIAGVTMAHCAPSHARMTPGSQVHAHDHHGHDAAAASHHAHAERAGTPHATDNVAVATAKGKVGDLAQHKCNSCASCGAVSALPSATPQLPAIAVATAVFVEDVITIDAFPADGPDRPPRTHLA